MSSIPQPHGPIGISDSILRPLRDVARRRWIVVAAVGSLQTLAISFAVLLAAAMVLGTYQQLPLLLRAPLALTTWGVVVWAAVRFLPPALRRWSLSDAALRVEATLPEVQERLSSAVELAGESDDRFRGSSSLVQHLLKQAEADARIVNPEAIISTQAVTRWGICLAPVLIAWLVLSILRPLQVEAGLYRLFNPFGNQLPAAVSQVAVYPGDATVAQGDGLEITAKVASAVAGTGSAVDQATLVSEFATGQSVSRALDSTGPRNFKIALTDLQQSFHYRVRTPVADSSWFNVTVNPRPSVASLDVQFSYLHYTRLEDRIVRGSDGTVEALAGTRATLIVHSSMPLRNRDGKKNQILIDEGKQTQLAVPLESAEGTDYRASFIVDHNAVYRIQLCNALGLSNKDDQPRNIIAHPDQPPTIAIISPAGTVSVRPDETVPVQYTASDDFGVASIQAVVQVDDIIPQVHEIHLSAKNAREIAAAYVLSVDSIIAASGATEARRITYQLKATDNREPEPQSSLSARQILVIDRGARSYSEVVDEEHARKLSEAIDKAVDHLNQADARSGPLRNQDPNHALTAPEKQTASEAEKHLADADRELHEQARAQETTPFSDVAKKAEQIADQSIERAAEKTAEAEMDADRPQQRAQSAEEAQKSIAQSREKLQQLKSDLQRAEQKEAAARDLQQAAKLQDEAARGFAEHPERTPENQQKQREAMQKLQEAMQKDPSLQDPQAQQLAQKLAALADRVQTLQKQETQQQDQTSKQEQARQAQAQAARLADEQKKLNAEVQAFAKDEHAPLEASHAQTPTADQENNIVSALDRHDVDNAAQQMKQQAAQLAQAARQLEAQARSKAPQATAEEQARQQQDKQQVEAARQEQRNAADAARELQQDAQRADPPDAGDPALQHAREQAEAIAKQADAIHPADADGQRLLDAARHDAAEAQKDAEAAAREADNADAKQDLSHAATQLRLAGRELTRAAEQNAKADRAQRRSQDNEQAADAAKEAADLADAQRQLADAAAQERGEAAQAQQDAASPEQTAQEQKRLADQAKEAGEQAAALNQEAVEAHNASLAHRADAAGENLRQAAQEQQQAADAEAKADPDHAAEHQEAAQHDLANAEAALRGLEPAQLAQGDAAQPADPDAAQPQGSPDPAAQPGPSPETPAQAQHRAAQLSQEAAAVQPQAMQPNPQAAQEAARALAQAAQANAAAQPGQPKSGEPEKGQVSGQEPGKPVQPGKLPVPALVSLLGITAQDGTGSARPEAVRAMGISADDWARLPTLMRKELMNAAQESGPPTYREMIKNYYVRIAREQSQSDEAQTSR